MSNRLLLLFLCINVRCFAQNLEEGEKIAPDRPGFGDAVSIAGKGSIHIETGTWLEQDKTDSLTVTGCGINSTLFRYGLFKKMELRMDYNVWNRSTPEIQESILGLFPFRAGMKFHLVYNKGLVPAITFIGMQELPFTATKNFRPNYPNTDLQLSFANKVNDWFALCYNLGAVLNAEGTRPLFYYALATEFTFSKKAGGYLQLHGTLQETKNFTGNSYAPYYLHYFEGGFMYYPGKNTQIDLSGGLKVEESFEQKRIGLRQHSWFFVSVGFSWRFVTGPKRDS